MTDSYKSKEPEFEALLEELKAVRKACLGPDKDRHAGAGGTAFERGERAKPVAPGTRAYSIGMTYQKTTKKVHPVESMKVPRDMSELDDELLLRQRLIKVMTVR